MTTEDRLKQYILTRYKSIREFTQEIGLPYSTMSTILKRGVDNSSVQNIIKICQALKISTDELAEGRIVPASALVSKPVKVEDIIANTKQMLMNHDNLTLNGQKIDEAEVKNILNSLDLLLEIQKRNINQEKKRMINNDKN